MYSANFTAPKVILSNPSFSFLFSEPTCFPPTVLNGRVNALSDSGSDLYLGSVECDAGKKIT
jgi:hypothetical protein